MEFVTSIILNVVPSLFPVPIVFRKMNPISDKWLFPVFNLIEIKKRQGGYQTVWNFMVSGSNIVVNNLSI